MKILAEITNENERDVYHIYDKQSFVIDLSSAPYHTIAKKSWFCSSNHLPNITERKNYFSNYSIDEKIAIQIQDKLNSGENVILTYDYATISSSIRWIGSSSLTIKSKHNITITNNVTIANNGSGLLKLMAGIEGEDSLATINFDRSGLVDMNNGGKVEVFYNPNIGNKLHKYHNVKSFYNNIKGKDVEIKALVNSMEDLQDINYFPSGSYALSRNLDASSFSSFLSISDSEQPFTGNFDGNNYEIANLEIYGGDNVSIFGVTIGSPIDKVQIKNLQLRNITVKGDAHVGIIASESVHTSFSNISFKNSKIVSSEISGAISGSADKCTISDVIGTNDIKISSAMPSGKIFGALKNSKVCGLDCKFEDVSCVGLSIHNMEGDDCA